MNIKIFSAIGTGVKKIFPALKKASVPVQEVVEKPVQKSIQEVRKEVVQQYLQKHLATPVKDVEKFASGEMLKELVNPKNESVRIVCYPARTVVDMKKANGTFVRRVYNPAGDTLMKEKIIYTDGTTKDIAIKSKKRFETKPATKYSGFVTEQIKSRAVKRNPDGQIVQTKDGLLTKEFGKPWSSSQYEIGSQNIIHTKNYEKGKQISGEIKKRTTSSDVGVPTFKDYAENPESGYKTIVPDKITTTTYTIPGGRQATKSYEWDYDMAGGKSTYYSKPIIKNLQPETLKVLSE